MRERETERGKERDIERNGEREREESEGGEIARER